MIDYLQASIDKTLAKLRSNGYKDYEPPFEKAAGVVFTGEDFEHARWIGDESLPVFFSYQMAYCIERLPWKMVEVLDEPDVQIKWFKRVGQ